MGRTEPRWMSLPISYKRLTGEDLLNGVRQLLCNNEIFVLQLRAFAWLGSSSSPFLGTQQHCQSRSVAAAEGSDLDLELLLGTCSEHFVRRRSNKVDWTGIIGSSQSVLAKAHGFPQHRRPRGLRYMRLGLVSGLDISQIIQTAPRQHMLQATLHELERLIQRTGALEKLADHLRPLRTRQTRSFSRPILHSVTGSGPSERELMVACAKGDST